MRLALAVITCTLAGCGGGDDAPPADATPPPRQVSADLAIDATGFSEPFTFVVPETTRSMTIVATGADDALYALGALQTADGVERVGLDLATPPGTAMRASYDVEQVGQMAGGLYQTIRLGTFTHVYPYRPDQAATPGEATLRIASDRPGPVHVEVLMPEDDGGKTLHLNLIAVSETLTIPSPPSFLDELQGIFGQVGITVVIDSSVELRGTGLSTITESTEPQEAPASMSAKLPALVGSNVSAAALDVFVVDALPFGIAGLSLGTPGPPVRGSYYYGVLVRPNAADGTLAVVIAHEVSHFLALQHVTNVGVSGKIYPDPLDDTGPNQSNLMQTGSTLTPDQGFSLSRSALLQAQ
ncbi:MAG TPA: hypothetical protein VFQ53_36285 [Kofleriaceae bacterium]|nr:hypothetical protein [Kofleriaceae bacterium]